MLSKKLAAIAAISMITASSAAVAQSAQPLSLSPSVERAAPGMQGQSSLDRRGYGIYIVGAVVLGLIIYGIIKLTDHNNGPKSP